MLKALHCADLHIEAPFSKESPEFALMRKEEMKNTFKRLIEYVNENEIDLVLIAGDLFDKNKVSESAAKYVFSLIGESKAKFVLSPGNHDYYSPDCVYAKSDIPDNMHIFKEPELSYVSYEINSERVRVYGYAFISPSLESPPFRNKKPIEDGAINILLAHGNMISSSVPDCPITVFDIKESGFDYIALGHIHNSLGIEREAGVYFGYSGSLEPRSFADCGERGAVLLEMKRSEGRFFCKSEFIPMAKRKYTVLKIRTDGLTEEQIYEKASEIIDLGFSEYDMLRIVFEGTLACDALLPIPMLKNRLEKVGLLEIKDNTLRLYNKNENTNELTVKGALLSVLSDKLSSEDEEERSIALMALKYAYLALDGEDVADYMEDM